MGGRRNKKRETARTKATNKALWVLGLGVILSLLVPVIGPVLAMGGAVYAFILGIGVLEKGGIQTGGVLIFSSVLLCALAIPLSSLGTGGWLGSKAQVFHDPAQRSFERNTGSRDLSPRPLYDDDRPTRMIMSRRVQFASESGKLWTVLMESGEEIEVIGIDKGILTIRSGDGVGQVPSRLTDFEETNP